MLVSRLHPSFLDIYNLLISSLESKALCIVISFLILWSICLIYFLVHFKDSPKYLTRGTAQAFISLMGFLQQSLFSRGFLVRLWYSLLIFLSSSPVCWCPLPVFPSTYHHHHHHHQVVLPAQISLTLSRHLSLSFIAFGRSSGLHPVSSHNCCMYVRAGRPACNFPILQEFWFFPNLEVLFLPLLLFFHFP